MQPIGEVTAGFHAAKAVLQVNGVDGANTDQIAQQAQDVGLIVHEGKDAAEINLRQIQTIGCSLTQQRKTCLNHY